MVNHLLKNRKTLVVTATTVVLILLSLGFKPWQFLTGTTTPPTPTPAARQKERISNPQNLGFDSLVSEKQPTIIASANPKLPNSLATYELNPAPYQLFSAVAAPALAAQFGFTENAKTSKSGNLFIYREKDKVLSIDSQIGTVSFTTDLSQLLSGEASLSPQQAGQKVEEVLKTISINSQFINWTSGEIKTMGLVQGKPKETGLKEELRFYQITPEITINNYQLLLPQPLYAQVSLTGEMVGLYTWFINLNGENPQVVNLKDLKDAEKEVESGQGLILQVSHKEGDRINLDQLELAYFAPPDFFTDFEKRHFLKIVYAFYNNTGNQVLVNAIKE